MIKVGILGIGLMGNKHAYNLMNMDDVEIVALCSLPISDAEKLKNEAHLECGIYSDGFEMIENTKMDILYICLPPFAHCGQFEAAAKKGVHIFIEKPIAINLERASSMVEASRKYNIHTQVGYHMRFGGAVEKFKQLIKDEIAGKPLLYSANYECNSLHGPWWRDVEKCGGQVFEQVIHLYDMASYIMGDVKQVNGYIANLNHWDITDYTVEDTSVSNLLFDNGSLGSITGTNCAVSNEWNGSFRVICQNMIADFKDHNEVEFIYTKDEKKKIEVLTFDDDAIAKEDQYFIDVIKGKEKSITTIYDGFSSLSVVSSVVESSKQNGAAIKIKN